MPSDMRVAMAREHHRQAAEATESSTRHREQRDALIRELRREDPERWTYRALGRAVGCSPELAATIIRMARV